MLHEGIEHLRGVMLPSRAKGKHRTRRRVGLWVLGIIVTLIVVLVVGSFFVDEPLRRHMETTMNQKLKGYSVRLPGLSFHPLGLSLTLQDLVIRQNAHPNPPVADIHALKAGVHWRALLHGALVADFLFDRPKVHIDLTHVRAEARSKTKLKDRGWQDALESVYPLKINRFRIRNGDFTYIDNKDPDRPVRVSGITLLAENIRNVRSAEHVYPSPIQMTATVFENGKLRVDGHANFLQEPFAGIDADIDLKHVELKYLKPVAEHANLRITKGVLRMDGHVEYAPNTEVVNLKELNISDVDIEYLHLPQTASAESQRIEKTEQAAKELSNKPKSLIKVDSLTVEHSTFGYVDDTKPPGYRVFISNADLTVKNFTNQDDQGSAGILLNGLFMGRGTANVEARFQPVGKEPDFDLDLKVENTPLQALNNLFRAYGNFDVEAGTFALYTQLAAHNGQMSGYIKPLFTDMKVLDLRRDEEKSAFRKMYEGLVGGVAGLFENPHGTVATKAEVSGSVKNPQVSTWNMLLHLVQNAFFKSILPGFERQVGGGAESGNG